MQHDGPINAVSRNHDVLAYDVGLTRPELREVRQTSSRFGEISGECDVIKQRVEPNIGHVVRIEWKFNSPRKPFFRARNAEAPEIRSIAVNNSSPPKFGIT